MSHFQTSRFAFEPLNRREFLTASAIAGLTVASSAAAQVPATSRAQRATSASRPIVRHAPRLSASLPAIGLGTFMAFDALPGEPRTHLREVMQRFWEAGGRTIDTSPLYGTAEISVGDFATSLGIEQQLIVANKIWSTGDYLWDDSHANRSLEQSLERLWRRNIDIMQCHSLVNVDVVVPLLKAWKAEGRIGHIGITHHEVAYFDPLAEWVERGEVDCVQVHYSMLTREAERRIFPAAAAQGVAVMVNMPFEKARLFKLVQNHSLPRFTQELDIETWGQYFLKWVISHPAVTCALPATSNPQHVVDNMRAMQGPLPDADLRQRMLRHIQALPGFDTLAKSPWYPDKRYSGVIGKAQSAIRSRGG